MKKFESTTQDLFDFSRVLKRFLKKSKIKVKIDIDKILGRVEITYLKKDPQTQKIYREIKQAMKTIGMNIDYRGRSFIAEAPDQADHFNNITDKQIGKGMQLLRELKKN